MSKRNYYLNPEQPVKQQCAAILDDERCNIVSMYIIILSPFFKLSELIYIGFSLMFGEYFTLYIG